MENFKEKFWEYAIHLEEGKAESILLDDNKRLDILTRSIKCDGETAKFIIAMEEMAELCKEISKVLRKKGDILNLLEEMADVQICLGFVQMISGITNEQLEAAIAVKLAREEERLAKLAQNKTEEKDARK